MHLVSEKTGIPSHKDEEGMISGLGLWLESNLRFWLRLGSSSAERLSLGFAGTRVSDEVFGVNRVWFGASSVWMWVRNPPKATEDPFFVTNVDGRWASYERRPWIQNWMNEHFGLAYKKDIKTVG